MKVKDLLFTLDARPVVLTVKGYCEDEKYYFLKALRLENGKADKQRMSGRPCLELASWWKKAATKQVESWNFDIRESIDADGDQNRTFFVEVWPKLEREPE